MMTTVYTSRSFRPVVDIIAIYMKSIFVCCAHDAKESEEKEEDDDTEKNIILMIWGNFFPESARFSLLYFLLALRVSVSVCVCIVHNIEPSYMKRERVYWIGSLAQNDRQNPFECSPPSHHFVVHNSENVEIVNVYRCFFFFFFFCLLNVILCWNHSIILRNNNQKCCILG